jgi:hypothetical protein
MAESTALEARDAWVELVELLSAWTPDRPMDVDLPGRALRLLLAPLGADDADTTAGTLLALADTAHHTVASAEYYAETVEVAVVAVIGTLQAAPPLTPLLAGGSPSTAREEVTGTPGAGSIEVPVTPDGGGSDE